MPPRVVPSAKPSPTSVSPILSPFWATKDGETVRLYLGNVTDVLSRMEEGSVQTVVTSPPYWGLRDYKTGSWEGGDPNCDHMKGKEVYRDPRSTLAGTTTAQNHSQETDWAKDKMSCRRCGARRVDFQLGSEPSPDCGTHGQAQCGKCFVCAMVAVFRGVRRVLRDDGTLWLNLGDTYASSPPGNKYDLSSIPSGPSGAYRRQHKRQLGNEEAKEVIYRDRGIPSGNLVGVPWRVALALQADGWILRQDIIWHKPSPMPESVRNRCTKAHEYVFLLTKSARYFCDMEAIKEKSVDPDASEARYRSEFNTGEKETIGAGRPGAGSVTPGLKEFSGNRNKRSVWSVSSQGYEGAHFATFPPKLITPCILAGTSARGRCSECGTPWKRVTVDTPLSRERPNDYTKRTGEEGTGNSCSNSVAGVDVKTVGWEPGCECFGKFEERVEILPKSSNRYSGGDRNQEGDAGASPRLNGGKTTKVREYVCSCGVRWANRERKEDPCSCYGEDSGRVFPCIVLDPFIGSGTTCVVSLEHGRWSWGIDLSETYLRNNAIPRVEGYLLSVPSLAALAGRETKKVMIGKVMTIGKGKGG